MEVTQAITGHNGHCLPLDRYLADMGSFHLDPHTPWGLPTTATRQGVQESRGPHATSRVPRPRGQVRCPTCMESALTISPPSRWPNCRARVDLPVPVAPRITTSGSVRCRPRNPELTGTTRAAAAAAILKASEHASKQLSPWQQSVRRRGSPAQTPGRVQRRRKLGDKGTMLGKPMT